MVLIPTQVKMGLGVFVFALIVLLSGTNYYQYQKIQEKNEKIVKQKVMVDSLREANIAWGEKIDVIRADYAKAQKDMLLLSQTVGELRKERDGAIAQLEKDKKRTSVVLAKPRLIERMSNRATVKVLNDLQCATGDLDKCGDKK